MGNLLDLSPEPRIAECLDIDVFLPVELEDDLEDEAPARRRVAAIRFSNVVEQSGSGSF